MSPLFRDISPTTLKTIDHRLPPLTPQTRLLVTHSVTYLPSVDHIVVVKDGRISEQGSYQQLLANKGEFQDFLIQYLAEEEAEDEDALPGQGNTRANNFP